MNFFAASFVFDLKDSSKFSIRYMIHTEGKTLKSESLNEESFSNYKTFADPAEDMTIWIGRGIKGYIFEVTVETSFTQIHELEKWKTEIG